MTPARDKRRPDRSFSPSTAWNQLQRGVSALYRWGPPFVLTHLAGGAVSGCEQASTGVDYGSPEEIHIPEPPFPGTAEVAGDYSIPQPYVCVYEQARLLGSDDPLAVTRHGRPIQEVARGISFDVLRQVRKATTDCGWFDTGAHLLDNERPASPAGRIGSAVPFTRQKPEINYYHWLTEQLPRLRGVEAYIDATGEVPGILVESDPPAWVSELLDLSGIPDDRRIEWTRKRADIDRLVVPKYTRKANPGPYEPSRADLSWVRERLRGAVPGDVSRDRSRLFVTRSDADTRRLENREAVGGMLRRHGFESITPTEYSVAEQIQLFRDADVIVGPHGAGLANILFAESATVVELFPSYYLPGYYYVIAELFGFEYRHLVGSEADPHFRVDVGRLESVIEEL